jgi:uncharacterized membrane protein HdeD (DUF308 family)
MIAAGVFALSDVVFATIISVKLIALIALAAGAFEIIHASWTKGWGGFAWQTLLGAIKSPAAYPGIYAGRDAGT